MKELQSTREQACLSELLAPTGLEAWGRSHAPEEAQRTHRLRVEEECIMTGYLQPIGQFVNLPEVQIPDGGYRGAARAPRGIRSQHRQLYGKAVPVVSWLQKTLCSNRSLAEVWAL